MHRDLKGLVVALAAMVLFTQWDAIELRVPSLFATPANTSVMIAGHDVTKAGFNDSDVSDL